MSCFDFSTCTGSDSGLFPKTAGQVLTYIKEVVVLEIGERAEVTTDRYCHYLTMA
ncbi:MAG: hypothetical protein OSJ56_09350 [Prevotella sp.]|uniref:hypothetical protein n=1 Tax=Prevotella sp. PTAC TaxID=2736295 RepID=UPI001305052F|nr:hypothetical protein [Prevotella sp. PTAC]MCX4294245.1 hypothetical protein [Prevotella sp.]NPD55178.1 hypothetical protein [Prevotella sp. PTAC]